LVSKPNIEPTSSLCSVARAASDVTDCPVSPFFLVFTHQDLLSWWHEALLQFFVFFPPRYEKGRVFLSPSHLPRSVGSKNATQEADDFFHGPYRTPRLTLQWVAGIQGKRVRTSSKLKLCKKIDDAKIC
jgi:hypothetical protein